VYLDWQENLDGDPSLGCLGYRENVIFLCEYVVSFCSRKRNCCRKLGAIKTLCEERISGMRCLTVHSFYQQRGGEDVVFEAEAAMLKRAGHTVECFTLGNDSLAGKSKLQALTLTLWNANTYRAFEARVADFRPHVVHFHNLFPLMSPSVLSAARRSGAALVMTLHNFRLLCPSANLYRDGAVCADCVPRKIKWPAILHKCYRNSRTASAAVGCLSAFQHLIGSLEGIDRFITPSRSAKDQFVAAGFPADRLMVKPNFIPPPPEPAIRERREAFALYVGRMVPEKGVQTLLDAWRRADAPPVPLVLVGEGPLGPTSDDGDGRIRWLGRRDPTEVHALMRRASLLVFPSEWHEPFGLTIIEAYANGLPVLAARIGAASEMVEPGATGFFFEPGCSDGLANAAADLLSDPEAIAVMGRRGQAKYRAEFTPDRNLEKLHAIYRAAVLDARKRLPAQAVWASAQIGREAG
jgi:glycosyltransferase involved in cell wall biosynthesis